MILYGDQFLPAAQVNISHNDRGYYFGDGVYEVFRVYRGRIFEKEAHLARLARSAAEVRLALPCPIPEIGQRLEKLVALNHVAEGTVYMQITRGIAPRNHVFPERAESVLLSYTRDIQPVASVSGQGMRVIVRPDIRWLRCDIKTLNLLPNVLCKQEAAEAGAGEAILHRDGVVTECSASNVMMVKNGILYTHPANHLILHGVTRAVTLKLAASLGIPVREEARTVDDYMEADEVMVTGTTVEVTPVIAIDDRPVGDGRPGKLAATLQRAFKQAITA